MKKWMAILLVLTLLLTLSGCGDVRRILGNIVELLGSDGPTDPTVSEQAIGQAAEALDLPVSAVEKLVESGFRPTSGGMTDHSIEELLAALENAEPRSPMAAAPVEGDYSGATAAVVTDEPWMDKGVEPVDITAGMTPPEKAAWEAFENTDWSEAFAETEKMVEEMAESVGGSLEGGEEGGTGDTEDVKVGMDGQWPINAFTKDLPKPDFQITTTVEASDGFTAAFGAMTKKQAVAYAEALQKAGYNQNVHVNDQEIMGMNIYSFSADNAAGYHAELTFTGVSNALTIVK